MFKKNEDSETPIACIILNAFAFLFISLFIGFAPITLVNCALLLEHPRDAIMLVCFGFVGVSCFALSQLVQRFFEFTEIYIRNHK